jgi:hypothetical protein
MNDQINRRRHDRVNVSGEHTVRFRMGGKSFTGLTMTNLSVGGCCLKVPTSQSEGMDKGALVSMVYLVHPRIPSVPLQASICWRLGKQPGATDGFVLVGLEFIDATPQFRATLEAYVQELLG